MRGATWGQYVLAFCLLGACAIALPARAQETPAPDAWTTCVNADNGATPQSAAEACGGIISAGRDSAANLAIAHYNRANHLARLADQAGAVADYEQALALGLRDPAVYYGLGLARYVNGDADGAINAYNEAIALNPNYADAIGNRGNVFQYARRDYPSALADYDRAIGVRDGAVDRHNRGNAYQYGLHDFERARADYDRSLELDPSRIELRVDRGNLSVSMGDMTQAFIEYDLAIAGRPDYAPAYFNRAKAHQNAGDAQSAIADYDQAARLDPSSGLFQYEACWLRAVMGLELDVARAACDRAIAIAPADPAYLVARGLVSLKQERFADAAADFDVAAQAGDPAGLYGRGVARRRLAAADPSLSEPAQADLSAAAAIQSDIAEEFSRYGVSP